MFEYTFPYPAKVDPIVVPAPVPPVDTWCQNIIHQIPEIDRSAHWLAPRFFWPTPKEAGAAPVLPSIDPVDTWCQNILHYTPVAEHIAQVVNLGTWNPYTPTGVTWTTVGLETLFTEGNWSNQNTYFECYIKATSGTFYARLLDTTDSTEVGGSVLTTTSATFDRLRIGPFALTDGHEYRVQTGSINSSTGELIGAQLIRIRP